jgi:hypothetical protein
MECFLSGRNIRTIYYIEEIFHTCNLKHYVVMLSDKFTLEIRQGRSFQEGLGPAAPLFSRTAG